MESFDASHRALTVRSPQGGRLERRGRRAECARPSIERSEQSAAVTTISNMTADAFVKRPPRDMRFFLVHGSDEGLVHERVKALVGAALQGAADPLLLTRLDGDAVARDPGALADEVYAVSMFGGARAVWIEAQARDLLPALTPLFARPPVDCTIVVEAGSLKRGAALRSAFEKAGQRGVDRMLSRRSAHARTADRRGSARRRHDHRGGGARLSGRTDGLGPRRDARRDRQAHSLRARQVRASRSTTSRRSSPTLRPRRSTRRSTLR